MPAHDSHHRPRRGARLQQPKDEEPTLVGEERYDDVPDDPVIIFLDSSSETEGDAVD